MQNSTIETHAKRNHQFDLPSSTTFIDSNKLQPPKLKPTIDSVTHTDAKTHANSNPRRRFNNTH